MTEGDGLTNWHISQEQNELEKEEGIRICDKRKHRVNPPLRPPLSYLPRASDKSERQDEQS